MRRCIIRSDVNRPETVARAVDPDHTDDVRTTTEDGAVVTTIERDTTRSLEATVDDYVVNLGVATTLVSILDQHDLQHHE
jgi:hypothetical protein